LGFEEQLEFPVPVEVVQLTAYVCTSDPVRLTINGVSAPDPILAMIDAVIDVELMLTVRF
jgi:hypothetical protein